MNQTNESALVFDISPDEVPVELFNCGPLKNQRLPVTFSRFRHYCTFGFVAASPEGVSALLAECRNTDRTKGSFACLDLARLCAAAKESAPRSGPRSRQGAGRFKRCAPEGAALRWASWVLWRKRRFPR